MTNMGTVVNLSKSHIQHPPAINTCNNNSLQLQQYRISPSNLALWDELCHILQRLRTSFVFRFQISKDRANPNKVQMPTVRLTPEGVMKWILWSNHQSFQPVPQSLYPLEVTRMK